MTSPPASSRIVPLFASSLLLRFLVTAVSVTASVMSLADAWLRAIPPPLPAAGSICQSLLFIGATRFAQADRAQQPDVLHELHAALRAHLECIEPVNPLPVPVDFFAALVLASVCLLGYLIWRSWRIWRQQLVPAESVPALGDELEQLRRIAEVNARFVVNLTNQRMGGLAFGHVGRRYVLLHRGLVNLAHTDRPAFRAIVLHELAHIRNRDLDVAYLTVLLLRAYLALFVVPALVLASGQLSDRSVSVTGNLGLWVQLGALAMIVLLNHNAVVRERELLADARAAQWGATADLSRVITAQRSGVEPAKHRWYRRVRELAALHPDPLRRAHMLSTPGVLFGANLAATFAVGLTLGLTTIPIFLNFTHALRAANLTPHDLFLPNLAIPALAVVTLPVGFTFGLSMWQSLSATGTLYARTVWAGLSLGGGLAVGELVISQDAPQLSLPFPLSINTRLMYVCILVLGSLLFTIWLVVCARSWPVTRLASYVVATATAVLFTVWLPLIVGIRLVTDPDKASPIEYLRSYATQMWRGWPVATVFMVLLVGLPAIGALLTLGNRISSAAVRKAPGSASR